MGHDIAFDTPCGSVGGWRADPVEAPRGALVVVQEIFGLTAHVRSVADRYAVAGYVALAPAFFHAVERGVELDYDQAGIAKGRALIGALGFERALAIVAAADALLRGESLRVGAVGFCWGGTVAFLSNTRLGLPAVSYYGSRNVQFLDEPLRAPMQFHSGSHDSSIPAVDVARIRATYPDAGVHVYPAGHGFNRDVDAHAYAADSARLAHARTLDFFATALAG